MIRQKQLIRLSHAACASVEDAEDDFTCLRCMPGFVFGYVDKVSRRVVSFHVDYDIAQHPLPPGTARVDCHFDLAELNGMVAS
jgi:hypothetical protein